MCSRVDVACLCSYVYIFYIHMYVCLCICVCVCVYKASKDRPGKRLPLYNI